MFLDLLLPYECKVDFVANMIAHSPREAGSAWLGRGFKPHPDVDAIAVEVVAFDDQVAEIGLWAAVLQLGESGSLPQKADHRRLYSTVSSVP